MRRIDPIVLAWVAGLALAALVYFVGPDRFLFRLLDTLHVLAWRISEAVAELSALTLDAMRALAIGLYATFVALSLVVARRGGRARAALIVVSVLFFLLTTGGVDVDDGTFGDGAPNGRWAAALVLAGVGAAVMTGRLRSAGSVALR